VISNISNPLSLKRIQILKYLASWALRPRLSIIYTDKGFLVNMSLSYSSSREMFYRQIILLICFKDKGVELARLESFAYLVLDQLGSFFTDRFGSVEA
jgi:hypothetical protein